MEQLWTFVDSRLAGFCFTCHDRPATRDHVPPRVFLDKPYPENLPVVGSCRACNEGASLDEEYVACLLEVAACGTTRPSELERSKIARKLMNSPSLAGRLAASFDREDDGYLTLTPEHGRVSRVVEKMARALWAFETGERTATMRATVALAPITMVPPDRVAEFLEERIPEILPEVGSRLMVRVLAAHGQPFMDHWQEVQPRRFSYAIDLSAGESCVKMIIRDYLAVEVGFAQAG